MLNMDQQLDVKENKQKKDPKMEKDLTMGKVLKVNKDFVEMNGLREKKDERKKEEKVSELNIEKEKRENKQNIEYKKKIEKKVNFLEDKDKHKNVGKGCLHILPLKRGRGDKLQVIGAAKINPEVGRIVCSPQKKNLMYIRCICQLLNI